MTQKQYTMPLDNIPVGSVLYVNGTLGYSRLANQIDGVELKRDIERKNANHISPVERPYTTATVRNPTIVRTDPNSPETPVEIYGREHIYSTKADPTAFNFSAYNKGKYLPWIAQLNPQTKEAEQIKPAGELANGLNVTLVIRVFKGSRGNGASLDGVIVNEPVRYYSSSRAESAIDALGLTFKPLPVEPAETDAPAPAAPAAPAAATQSAVETVTQPVANPYASTAQAPVQPQAAPVAAPVPPSAPATTPFDQGGIVYNPQGNRNY